MSASLKTIQFSLGLFVYTLHLNSYAACIDNGTVFDCDNTISGNPDAKYQTVNITTTAIGGTAPLAGFGVYGNNNTQFRFNTLNVNTTGKDADALRLRIIASMDIDKLVIHTSGSSADAINVTDEAKGSTLRIGDNALITAQSGVGIRVNSGPDAGKNNVVTLGKNAYIETHGSGSNAIDTVGYAVYAGNRNWQAAKAKGNAIIHLGDDSTIITHGNNAHAVYANRGGGITLGHTTIRTDHKGAFGLHAETLSARSSYIALNGNVDISTAADGKAIYAKGIGSTIKSLQPGVFILNGNISAEANGWVDLKMTNGSRFKGLSDTGSNGTVNLSMSGPDSQWDLVGHANVSNLTLAQAAVAFNHGDGAFKTLTVKQNYTSNHGALHFKTELGDDASKTDKLLIQGDSQGDTRVFIDGVSGSGAVTQAGIKLIEVAGASNGLFIQQGRVVAGAYDYHLARDTQNNKDWSLTSKLSPTEPTEPPVTPDPPVTPPDPPEPPIPPKPPAPDVHRPELGSYLGNYLASNTLFNLRLQDRVGTAALANDSLKDAATGTVWTRIVSGQTRFEDNSGQVSTRSDHKVIQLGTDLWQWRPDQQQSVHLGVMAGYGDNKAKAKASLSGYAATGKLEGYHLGVYGTWYQDLPEEAGLYVDGWLMYNHFNNKVTGQNMPTERYRASGWTASIESGYTHPLSPSGQQNTRWYVQPKAQLIWMGVKTGDVVEHNGTRIHHQGDNNLQSRLGVRLYAEQVRPSTTTQQYYVELNWLHNSRQHALQMNQTPAQIAGMGNVGEVKLGLEAKLATRTQLWANLGYQFGQDGHRDVSGMFGLKQLF